MKIISFLAVLGAFGLAAPNVHAQGAYTFTPISVPGAVYGTYAHGINSTGQIVGYDDHDGFAYAGGAFTTLDAPGATNTYAEGINDAGQVVGFYNDASAYTHGFVETGGVFTALDAPGAVGTAGGTQAIGISSTGQVVGFFHDAAQQAHAFLYSSGTFSILNVPGAVDTYAYGINSAGQIVGYYHDANFNGHGFVYAAGAYLAFDAPGASSNTYGYGINDAGQIVGTSTSFGQARGFLATPAPEPSQCAALGIGLLGLSALAVKARRKAVA